MSVLTAGITACLSLFEYMNRVLDVVRTVAIGGPPMTVSSGLKARRGPEGQDEHTRIYSIRLVVVSRQRAVD